MPALAGLHALVLRLLEPPCSRGSSPGCLLPEHGWLHPLPGPRLSLLAAGPCRFRPTQAMEARRREKERPWIQLLAVASLAATVLLAAVLYRLEHMP